MYCSEFNRYVIRLYYTVNSAFSILYSGRCLMDHWSVDGIKLPRMTSIKLLFYMKLVGLPSFAWDFYCQLCLYVSLYLCLSVSLSLPSISPKPNLTLNMTGCWPGHPPLSFSHPPPSLFSDKKFPVEAHFWLDKLFYYIEDVCWSSFYFSYYYIYFFQSVIAISLSLPQSDPIKRPLLHSFG